MKKIVLNFVCCFVPFSGLRHKIRKIAGGVINNGKNNIIEIVDKHGNRARVKKVPGCEFVFSGDNNHIVLYEPLKNLKLKVRVTSGVFVEIYGSNIGGRRISVVKDRGLNQKNRLIIGKNFSSTNFVFFNFCHGGGDIIVGDDCMFSWDVHVWTGDFHSVYDLDTKELLNPNKDVVIGNGVWIGAECRILKGSIISDNTVVGMRSVVAHQFMDGNVVIAGTPARVVKSAVGWNRACPEDYI